MKTTSLLWLKRLSFAVCLIAAINTAHAAPLGELRTAGVNIALEQVGTEFSLRIRNPQASEIPNTSIFHLDNPKRLVVDVAHNRQGKPQRISLSHEALKAVRVGFHPKKMRIVIDVREGPAINYKTAKDIGSVIVNFTLSGAAVTAIKPATDKTPPVVAKPLAPKPVAAKPVAAKPVAAKPVAVLKPQVNVATAKVATPAKKVAQKAKQPLKKSPVVVKPAEQAKPIAKRPTQTKPSVQKSVKKKVKKESKPRKVITAPSTTAAKKQPDSAGEQDSIYDTTHLTERYKALQDVSRDVFMQGAKPQKPKIDLNAAPWNAEQPLSTPPLLSGTDYWIVGALCFTVMVLGLVWLASRRKAQLIPAQEVECHTINGAASRSNTNRVRSTEQSESVRTALENRAHRKRLAECYAALGIEPECSDSELKQTYKKLAKVYHDDKLSSHDLPEEIRDLAVGKFRLIQDAYECLKEERGMK